MSKAAAKALTLAAIRMNEGFYRGFDIMYRQNDTKHPWQWDEIKGIRYGFASTPSAARRAVDNLIDGDKQ